MRAFLLACLGVVAIGAAGYFLLDATQQPAGAAFTTASARIDPAWSWRNASTAPCKPRQDWQWFFVDFRDPSGESGLCSFSQ